MALRIVVLLIGATSIAISGEIPDSKFSSSPVKNADATAFAELESRTKSRIGLAAIDVSTHRRVEYRAHERFLMCSTFKVPAVAAVLKRVDDKKEQLDRFVRYSQDQLLAYAPVTRAHVDEGGMTLGALCAAAIEQSDNTAGNLLLNAIGGPKGLTDLLRGLGDQFTRLDRPEPDLNVPVPGDDLDTTTPAAICADLEKFFGSDFLSPTSREWLENWMQDSQTGLKMIRATVPADWKVGNKTGRSSQGATNDLAVARRPNGAPIFLAVYVVDPGESAEARDKLVADLAKIVIERLTK
ncbi:MAG TPA: class A beta-lactamase [Chthoniobacterales bacterium]|jgi:beta-lactamase class A